MKGFLFGTDYYPEHWPRARWETDARMMQEMGLDMVRMAEFSWQKMEPAEGQFCFAWLDEAIEILAAHGIRTVLGTPTAAPPAWIIAQDPTIQPVDADGHVHGFGGRHHDCQSHPGYRRHIERFVTAFTQHFGNNPNVIGWQVDNELGNSHDDLCHCEHCRKRFQNWLAQKYTDIDQLNTRWGTAFWSQGYTSFAEIDTPKKTAAGQNPSHLLDWRRFCADLVQEFHDFQAQIIRRNSPGRFITQNMMGFCDKFRYNVLAEELEFASHDQYPGGHFLPRPSDPNPAGNASTLDFIRSLKEQPFAIMEQQSSITGWEVLGRAPKPGQLAMWSAQSIAHGADAVVWFRWRSCVMGTEEYWHGLLPHSGIPKRNFRELSDFVRNMKPVLGQLQGAMPEKQAGILFSYDQLWANRIQPHHPKLRYVDHLQTWYQALYQAQIPVDYTWIDRDLSAYRLLVAPLWFLTDPAENEKLKTYVREGGTLVLDIRAGIKDVDNICIMDKPLPAGLDDLAGIEVDEYDCLIDVPGNTVIIDGKIYPCTKWCDILHTTTADAVGQWGQEFYAGTPAITRNRYGKGQVWYVGTEISEELGEALISLLIPAAGLAPIGTCEKGAELTVRTKGSISWLFAINHTDEEKLITIPVGWTQVLGGNGDRLAAFEYRIYRKNTH